MPEKPYSDPGNYNRVAQRLSEEKGWFWANQFDNTANRLAHYRTTGPEIWEQTAGEVTAFVSSVGTGGTLAGVALTVVYQLLREEGLFLGLSSGINIAGAARFAKERGPGQTIVTILCDSGHKYQSKIFNSEWLAAHGLDPNQAIDIFILEFS